MTRQHLYKAQRTDNGEWVEGYYFKQGNGCDSLLSYIKRVTDTVHVDPATVCEFCGIPDVQIFEGDVVALYGMVGTVEYKDDVASYLIHWENGNCSLFLDLFTAPCGNAIHDIEVLRNIHDKEVRDE